MPNGPSEIETKTETSLTKDELEAVRIEQQLNYLANHITCAELIDLFKKYGYSNSIPARENSMFPLPDNLDGLDPLRKISKREFELISFSEIADCLNQNDLRVFKDRFPCDSDGNRNKMIRELACLFHKPPTFLNDNPRFSTLKKYI